MRSILLAFANPEAVSKVKNILVSAGLPVSMTCSNGTALLQQAMLYEAGGVIILPSRLPDISIPDLLSRLPDTFDLLVLQSATIRADYDQLPGLTKMDMPMPSAMLVDMVTSLLNTRTPSGRGRTYGAKANQTQATAHKRTLAEEQIMREAKHYLIYERQMTEDQAHRYLQKRSMVSGVRLIEIAQDIIEHGTD
jgi:hypothetical protein